jgi:hypothetical protein
MNGCSDRLHRLAKPRWECARDTVGDVDPMSITVSIDDRSEEPMEHWKEHLKRQRRKKKPQPAESDPPATPGRRPPDSLIDEYAAPRPS